MCNSFIFFIHNCAYIFCTKDSHQHISGEVSTRERREVGETSCRVCESIFGTQLSSLSRDATRQMRAADHYFQHGRCDVTSCMCASRNTAGSALRITSCAVCTGTRAESVFLFSTARAIYASRICSRESARTHARMQRIASPARITRDSHRLCVAKNKRVREKRVKFEKKSQVTLLIARDVSSKPKIIPLE